MLEGVGKFLTAHCVPCCIFVGLIKLPLFQETEASFIQQDKRGGVSLIVFSSIFADEHGFLTKTFRMLSQENGLENIFWPFVDKIALRKHDLRCLRAG